nr:hypothetical protein [Halomonas bluephagenesis]
MRLSGLYGSRARHLQIFLCDQRKDFALGVSQVVFRQHVPFVLLTARCDFLPDRSPISLITVARPQGYGLPLGDTLTAKHGFEVAKFTDGHGGCPD